MGKLLGRDGGRPRAAVPEGPVQVLREGEPGAGPASGRDAARGRRRLTRGEAAAAGRD